MQKKTVIACVVVLLAAAVAQAQTDPGFFLDASVFRPSVSGADVNVGATFGVREIATRTPNGTNLASGFDHQSLDVVMKTSQPISFGGRMGRVWPTYGLGVFVGASRYQFGGSLDGRVMTPPGSSNNSFLYDSIDFFGYHYPTPDNMFGSSGRSDVGYYGEASLKLLRFEAAGSWVAMNYNHAKGVVFGGVSVLRVDSSRSEGFVTEGFLYDARSKAGIIQNKHYDSSSEGYATMMGPMIGVQFNGLLIGEAGTNGLSLNLRVSQSWLRGDVTESGEWTIREKGLLGTVVGSSLSRGTELYHTDTLDTLDRNTRSSTQVTDLEAALRFRLLEGCLEVGPAISMARFQDLPVAASMHVLAPLARVWDRRSQSPTVKAIALTATVRF